MKFGRLLTAMATPFSGDGIDWLALERLIEHLIASGTTGIVVSGTTGESPTLSHLEKLQLFEQTVKLVNGRIPVMAGTGGNNTADTIQLSKEAERLGVQGLLLVAPYYNRPTQEGLYAHFKKISEHVTLPIMLYNVPSRCGVNIDANTILQLSLEPNIFAVKEASGNFTQILDLAAHKADDFLLYSGDDKLTLPMMSVGAFGVVSVASHLVGLEMTTMIEDFITGRVASAATWNGRLLPIFDSLFRVSSPAPLKAALQLLNVSCGSVRLPLVAAPGLVVDELRDELQRLGKLSV